MQVPAEHQLGKDMSSQDCSILSICWLRPWHEELSSELNRSASAWPTNTLAASAMVHFKLIYIYFFVFHLVVASLNWKPHPNSSVQEQANESLNNILHKISYAGVWILQMNFGKQSAIAEQKRGQPNVPIALADASSTSTNVHLASDNIKRHRNNRMVLLLVKNCWTKFEYIISHDMHFTDRHWALVC